MDVSADISVDCQWIYWLLCRPILGWLSSHSWPSIDPEVFSCWSSICGQIDQQSIEIVSVVSPIYWWIVGWVWVMYRSTIAIVFTQYFALCYKIRQLTCNGHWFLFRMSVLAVCRPKDCSSQGSRDCSVLETAASCPEQSIDPRSSAGHISVKMHRVWLTVGWY